MDSACRPCCFNAKAAYEIGQCLEFTGVLFFSPSRRRHTRLVSDWSPDVCSSDLVSYWPAFACVAWRTSLLASERRSALNHTTSHNRPGRAIPHNGSSIRPPEQFAALLVCPDRKSVV